MVRRAGHEAGLAEQLKAEIRTHTRISGIDPGHKRLWIGEEAIAYRDLVLAWGAQTVRVPIEGDGAERVFPINDLEDYARFRAAAFAYVRGLLESNGGLVTRLQLEAFEFEGKRVPLIERQRGIRKVAWLEVGSESAISPVVGSWDSATA